MPLSGTLTKAKIIDAVAESNGYTRKKSIETVETVLELIKHSLESGEDVLISGFGKFCVKKKRERRGRNPATREDMMLAPRQGRSSEKRCSQHFAEAVEVPRG